VVDTAYTEKPFSALYGPPIMTTVRVDTCPNCLESGDFESDNDRAIEASLDLSSLKGVPGMMQKMETHGITRPFIERVMGLPQGSIAKCEAGEYNAAVIIALRTAVTFPPILHMLDLAANPNGDPPKAIES
jgi:hypothetical protein